jgi:ribosome biogenesis GTPase
MMRQFAADIRKRRTPEELKQQKLASNQRKAAERTGGRADVPVDEDNWEAVEARAIAKSRTSKLSKRDLRTRGVAATEGRAAGAGATTAMVVSTTRRWCKALLEGEMIDCELPRDMALVQKSTLAVGDRIVASQREGRFAVEQVLPRQTKLSRPDPHQPSLERVVAANIDLVVCLVSIGSPPLRPGLIDRYLVAIQRGGAQPLLCVNKVDLADENELEQARTMLAIYSELGVPVIWISAETGAGLGELRDALRGKTAVFVGHSGVGKSSTLNALAPDLALRTSEVHKFGAGRHTTSSSTLHDLGEGTLIIDTPGIREFGLWQMDPESLRWYFPEFAEASQFCRYPDCTHTHEPVCGVKEAVLEGTLPAARYQTYIRLLEDAGTSPA